MMVYQIDLTNRAEKELKTLDKLFKEKVSLTIDLLASNPFLGEKMGGEFRGCYRVKIPPLRIIYILDIPNRKIMVIAIRHRQGAYK